MKCYLVIYLVWLISAIYLINEINCSLILCFFFFFFLECPYNNWHSRYIIYRNEMEIIKSTDFIWNWCWKEYIISHIIFEIYISCIRMMEAYYWAHNLLWLLAAWNLTLLMHLTLFVMNILELFVYIFFFPPNETCNWNNCTSNILSLCLIIYCSYFSPTLVFQITIYITFRTLVITIWIMYTVANSTFLISVTLIAQNLVYRCFCNKSKEGNNLNNKLRFTATAATSPDHWITKVLAFLLPNQSTRPHHIHNKKKKNLCPS